MWERPFHCSCFLRMVTPSLPLYSFFPIVWDRSGELYGDSSTIRRQFLKLSRMLYTDSVDLGLRHALKLFEKPVEVNLELRSCFLSVCWSHTMEGKEEGEGKGGPS